jgi:hypothetical protein
MYGLTDLRDEWLEGKTLYAFIRMQTGHDYVTVQVELIDSLVVLWKSFDFINIRVIIETLLFITRSY